jgi:hypothetical protein
MKKNLFLLGLAVLLAAVVVSCKKDDDGDNNTVKSYLLKSVSFYAEWAGGTESWEFTYDATSKKVTKFDNLWEGALDKTITYDYATAGKLILMKGTEVYNSYDLNASGYVTKEPWSETEWASFEYDANGYLVKGYEHWGDADHLKYEVTITDGNIKQIKTYDDDGTTVKKIKEFTYTIGDNVNGLHQANLIDSEWKPVGNFYGKPSKKLVDYFEYWDPREASPVKSKSSLEYTFDAMDRATKVVKTLSDNSTETWDYTYYE